MATTGDETLLDEQRRRPQAASAAIGAGILSLGGAILATRVFAGRPEAPLLGLLRERLQTPPPQPGLKAVEVGWYADNSSVLILVFVVLALAAAAIGLALWHLYRSVKARRPELPRYALYAAIAGSVLVGVTGIAQVLHQTQRAAAFADGANQTSVAAPDLLRSTFMVVVQTLGGLGGLALGAAIVMLSLNAMKVGLLTRFVGVLGIIVGVLFVLPIGSSLPLLPAFWFVAVGALFLGRWPRGLPPAWVTGDAQPWPTQQEQREARMAAQPDDDEQAGPRQAKRLERAEPPETPAPELPARRPHSSSKKRKRRRR